MRFSFQVGLTLKVGVNLYELVRIFDDDTVQFEDTKTRRTLTLHRDEVVNRIYNGKYSVVLGDHVPKDQKTKGNTTEFLDLNSLSERERNKLDKRYAFVKAFQRSGITRGQRSKIKVELGKIAERLGIQKVPSTSAVMKWMRDYQTGSCNAVTLVDRYRVAKRDNKLSVALEGLIWKVLRREYFTRARHSATHAYNQLQTEIKEATKTGGIAANESVSYPTLMRRIKDVDLYHRVATREGTARARMVCRTAFPDGYPNYPLERVEIDHTPLNWVIICDRTGLPLGRPVLTVMIDAYSGYILGFYLSFYGPGLTSVSGVVRSALLPKNSVVDAAGLSNQWLSHGLGDEWVLDNGLEFHSFGFKQMAMCLGVDLMFCRVRTPWLKPHVERFFSTLNTVTLMRGKITKSMANVTRIDPYKDAAITFSDLAKGLLQFIVDVHPFEPNWRKMARPFDLFQEGLERCPPAMYPGNLDDLKLASGMSKLLTLGPGGIELMGLPYGSFGFKDIANKHGTRIKVLCKWDPDDLSTLYVQPPQSQEWIAATCRWQTYANGLSHNQHRLIRQFAKEDLKNSGAVEYLVQAKQRLHDHWLDATANRRSAGAQLAGRFANYTSGHVLGSGNTTRHEKSQTDGQAAAAAETPPKLLVEQDYTFLTKDIPIFESFSL